MKACRSLSSGADGLRVGTELDGDSHRDRQQHHGFPAIEQHEPRPVRRHGDEPAQARVALPEMTEKVGVPPRRCFREEPVHYGGEADLQDVVLLGQQLSERASRFDDDGRDAVRMQRGEDPADPNLRQRSIRAQDLEHLRRVHDRDREERATVDGGEVRRVREHRNRRASDFRSPAPRGTSRGGLRYRRASCRVPEERQRARWSGAGQAR